MSDAASEHQLLNLPTVMLSHKDRIRSMNKTTSVTGVSKQTNEVLRAVMPSSLSPGFNVHGQECRCAKPAGPSALQQGMAALALLPAASTAHTPSQELNTLFNLAVELKMFLCPAVFYLGEKSFPSENH